MVELIPLRIVFIWGDNIQEGAGILQIEIDKESTLKSEKNCISGGGPGEGSRRSRRRFPGAG